MKVTTIINELAPCAHPVPENNLGYFAQHSRDNVPMSEKTALEIIEGTLTAMQKSLTEELGRKS